MRLRFTPGALTELDDILSYIGARSPDGSRRVKKRLKDTFEIIRLRPAIGRRTTDAQLRCIAATPYPYLVFYEARSDDVVVIAVRHTARDPASMPGA